LPIGHKLALDFERLVFIIHAFHSIWGPEMVERSPLPAPEFQYRNNGDGTWDSICLRCFLTVGTAGTTKQLGEMEKAHICYTKKPPRAQTKSADRE
jgi:hypothetical protein